MRTLTLLTRLPMRFLNPLRPSSSFRPFSTRRPIKFTVIDHNDPDPIKQVEGVIAHKEGTLTFYSPVHTNTLPHSPTLSHTLHLYTLFTYTQTNPSLPPLLSPRRIPKNNRPLPPFPHPLKPNDPPPKLVNRNRRCLRW